LKYREFMEQQQVAGSVKSSTRRSEEEILKHLEDQEKSGFAVKDYCEMYDIVEQTFYSWIKRYRNRSDDEVKGFATIELLQPPGQAKPVLFASVGNIRLYREVPAEYLKALLS